MKQSKNRHQLLLVIFSFAVSLISSSANSGGLLENLKTIVESDHGDKKALSQEEKLQKDKSKTIGQGALTGGLIGAGLGVIVGDNKESAAIGGAIGSLVGAKHGEKVAKDKAEYAQKEQNFRKRIKDAETLLAISEKSRETLRREIALLEDRKKSFNAKSIDNERQAALKKREQSSLKKELEKSQLVLAKIDKKIADHKTTIAQESDIMPANWRNSMVKSLQDMEREKEDLSLLLAKLESLERRRAY